jgi:hypothetical protein
MDTYTHRDSADEYTKGTDTMDVWFDSGTSWAGTHTSHIHTHALSITHGHTCTSTYISFITHIHTRSHTDHVYNYMHTHICMHTDIHTYDWSIEVSAIVFGNALLPSFLFCFSLSSSLLLYFSHPPPRVSFLSHSSLPLSPTPSPQVSSTLETSSPTLQTCT